MSPIDLAEYEVYTAACLAHLGHREDRGSAVFADETRCERRAIHPLERLVGPVRYRCLQCPEVLEDYAAKNALPSRLEKRFQVPGGFRFRSEAFPLEPDRVYGLFAVSRVGFGRGGTRALVYLEFRGGLGCGYGEYLVLDRDASGWRVAAAQSAWVS